MKFILRTVLASLITYGMRKVLNDRPNKTTPDA